MHFLTPPITLTDQGRMRRVGFEFEYSQLDLNSAAGCIQNVYGGEIRPDSQFSLKIENTSAGRFEVKIDTSLLSEREYEKLLRKVGIEVNDLPMKKDLEEVLLKVASTIIPHEIITPPLPINDLEPVDSLRECLRKARAKGTRESFIYAFGLHINPEVASEDPLAILDILRSFFLLLPWIVFRSEIDFTRKLTPYINDFPEGYIRHVLDPDYSPDADTLIRDYLSYNPTRNRPLDLLPLFATMDKELVMSRAKQQKMIKPRPAFHYRLPNSLMDDPSWTIAREWNMWVRVEELAHDKDRLEELGLRYLKMLRVHDKKGIENWPKQVNQWLE